MSIPAFRTDGNVPPGIYGASLADVAAVLGDGSEERRNAMRLLEEIVAAARSYPTIKRVLLWGSFVTTKPDPADLDYSVVVSVEHDLTAIAREHERFFVPFAARRYYGVDAGYVLIRDWPVEEYVEDLDFLCHDRERLVRGIVEISVWGEYVRGKP